MTGHRAPAARAAGFTLVELLIALALTGLVALVLVAGTRLAAMGLNRVSAQAERLQERRGLEELLRRALGAALAAPLSGAVVPLTGGPARIDFLSVAEDGGAGLWRVTLAAERRGAAETLVLTRQRVGAAGDRDRERAVLAQRLRRLDIAYFGAAPNEAPAWRDRWDGLRTLPNLVRIAIDTGDGLTRPPLVVRLWTAPP